MSEPSCPSCGVLTGSSQLRLVVDTCGHQKCRRCLLQEETGCAQCRAQRCSVIVRLDSQEGLEQQLENIYLSDHGEEEEEEEDAASIQSDINAELLLGVRGDIVQHWVEDNHFEESEELIEELQDILQQDQDVPDPHPESVISRGINNSQRFLEEIQSALNIEGHSSSIKMMKIMMMLILRIMMLMMIMRKILLVMIGL